MHRVEEEKTAAATKLNTMFTVVKSFTFPGVVQPPDVD